jgi:hypothetical protein
MALKACCGDPGETRASMSRPCRARPAHPSRRPRIQYKFLADCTYPKLFLSGDHDQFAPATQLAQVADSAAEPKRLLFIPGADHFFTGQLEPCNRRWPVGSRSNCNDPGQRNRAGISAHHGHGIFTGALAACDIASAFDRRLRFEGNTLHRLVPDGSGPATINLGATSASSSSRWARPRDPCWIRCWTA